MTTQRDCMTFPLLVNERALQGYLNRLDRSLAPASMVRPTFTRKRKAAK